MNRRVAGFAVAVTVALCGCGSDGVDEGAYCTAVLDLVADPLDADLARTAADAAPDDEQRRLLEWQAELADLVLDPEYAPGTLPDWEALGFDDPPTVDDMAAQLGAAAADCAGVSST